MSFLSKQDYFGLSTVTGSNLVITSSDENWSAQTAEAIDEKGDVVKVEEYGEVMNPSCSYIVKGDVSLSDLVMGDEISGTDSNYTMTSIQISTGAGTPPSVSVSGEGVPSGTHCSDDCVYQIPSASLEACHHAQALWGFSFPSTTFYVTQATYSAECQLTKATKDGETVKYDITGGKLTATFTIQGTGGTGRPSITPPTGGEWIETSPMSMSNPDGGYETYSVTYQKNLAHSST